MSTGGWDIPVSVPLGDFTPCPAGNHAGRVSAIMDIGHQRVERSNKDGTRFEEDVHQIVIVFELAKKQPNGSPFTIGIRYTWSMHPQSSLYAFVESVTGEKPQPGSVFNPLKLLGTPVMVSVVMSAPNAMGRQYSNVSGVSAFPEDFPAPKFVHEPLAWRVTDGASFPDRSWFPYIYGKPISMLAEMSCEARGVPPLKRSSSSNGQPSSHSFDAPTHAQSVGKPDAEDAALVALRTKYGLPDQFTFDDLKAKVDDIPPADYRALDAHAVPF